MRITKRLLIVLAAIVLLYGISIIPLAVFNARTADSVTITGFHMDNDSIYYYDDDGNIMTGWQTINGDRFYFDKSGKMVTGEQVIDGKKYKFGDNGKLVFEETDRSRMDEKAASYSSDTDYLILVNCSTHRVGIYEGKSGSWQNRYYWKCGDGAPGMETIKGDFKMGETANNVWKYHLPYFDSEGGRLWYATRIHGHYLFHSVLYEIEPSPKTIKDGTVGAGVSHGCIRLELDNAKWIYENIPMNTRCIIYQ